MRIAVLFSALMGSMGSVYAVQNLVADEGKSLSATISSKEMTRISIEGGRILSVRKSAGELEMEKDEESGQVFIKPLVKKEVNLFVTSESGKTYLLLLTPSAINADSVVIQERTALIKAEANLLAQAQKNNPIAKKPAYLAQDIHSDAYVRSIKQLFLVMASGVEDQSVEVTPAYEEVPLWKEVVFVKEADYSNNSLLGEKYHIVNASAEQMVLEEQEFFRKNVVAVSLRKSVLQMGEGTDVYIISVRDE